MKKTISIVISCLCFLLVNGALAQQHTYPEIYPHLPFDLKKSADAGNLKTTVWYGTYTKGEGDESGYMWSNSVEFSYQFQRYEYFDSKMQMMTEYLPNGDKKFSREYFYKNDLLTAIEIMSYDTLQESHYEGSFIYVYYKDGRPFQRVRMFGFPNKGVRLLDEFAFDENNKVVRQKTTAVGLGPDMDSLTGGLKDKDTRLKTSQYTDTSHAVQLFKQVNKLQEESVTIYNEEGLPGRTVVTGADGRMIVTIDYEYSGGQLVKKTHWIDNIGSDSTLVVEEENPNGKKKKKKKKEKKKFLDLGELGDDVDGIKEDDGEIEKASEDITEKAEEATSEDKSVDEFAVAEEEPQIPAEFEGMVLYRVEYFTYDEDGLLETHIIEENGLQTVYEFTHLTE